MEMRGGGGWGEYKLVPGKMFSGIESDFSQVLVNSRGKYRIAMTRSILERNFF